ncbi:unnamed protein product, partial [Ectocarpus sp. 13 AM-2016]
VICVHEPCHCAPHVPYDILLLILQCIQVNIQWNDIITVVLANQYDHRTTYVVPGTPTHLIHRYRTACRHTWCHIHCVYWAGIINRYRYGGCETNKIVLRPVFVHIFNLMLFFTISIVNTNLGGGNYLKRF